MFDFIARPVGMLLVFLYNTFQNYGIAIVVLTLLIRLVLLPLYYKQMKSTAKTQKLQPKIKELQKRYKNDKDKLSQEQMKLYKEEGVNPMGGCLPTLIQLPILFGLIAVFREPLKFMYGYSAEMIEAAVAKLPEAMHGTYQQVYAVVTEKGLNMNFLGFWDLSQVPRWNPAGIMENPKVFIPLLLIPILSAITTYISMKMSNNAMFGKKDKNAPKGQKSEADAMGGANNMMAYMFPLLSLWLGFSVPASLGLYWFIGYIFQIGQQIVIQKIMEKKEKEKEEEDAKIA